VRLAGGGRLGSIRAGEEDWTHPVCGKAWKRRMVGQRNGE